MEQLKLKYQLTKEEIEETLLCLAWRQEGKLKSVNLGILSILGVMVLIAYMRRPDRFFWFFMLLTIILLMFYLWYGPRQKRKKMAKEMTGRGGSYQIIIEDDYIEPAGGSEKIMLKEEKIRFYISENMYICKTAQMVCAIPKRILSREQEEKLIWLTRRYRADTVNVVIKKE